jgi:hypothetical protein
LNAIGADSIVAKKAAKAGGKSKTPKKGKSK